MLGRLFSPRLVALVWAVYAAGTSLGYVGKAVPSLTPVEAVLPAGSPAIAWAIAAGLLLVGAVPPPSSKLARIGRVTRTAGIAISGALLAMWAVNYGIHSFLEGSRMWISSKNYAMLAAAAMASGAVLGRDRAKP